MKLNNIIINQKNYKDSILTNYDNLYIERDKYKSSLKLLDSTQIKVIMGPRRSGKSVFCFQLLKNKTFAYFNFDDEQIDLENLDTTDFMKEISNVYGKTEYIFFDEIQNLNNWELFINRLHREGHNIIITGSNARLLSRELSSHLSGRHFIIEILPFNFNEYIKYRTAPENITKLDDINNYLFKGGYPQVIANPTLIKDYLSGIYNDLIFTDIVKRHNIRLLSQIESIANYFINNFSSTFTNKGIKDKINANSVTTIDKFISYFIDAYIIFSLNVYSIKVANRIRMPRKIYLIDNGFVYAKTLSPSENYGKLLENLVFTELLKYDFKVNTNLFYYKTRNNKEVDFIIKDDNKIKTLIQVCYNTENYETQKREYSALWEASGELNCDNLLIVSYTNNPDIVYKDKKIKYISIGDFLNNPKDYI